MSKRRSRIETLQAEIEIWEHRKTEAALAYDNKIAKLKTLLDSELASEAFFSRDTSQGSMLRPHPSKRPPPRG